MRSATIRAAQVTLTRNPRLLGQDFPFEAPINIDENKARLLWRCECALEAVQKPRDFGPARVQRRNLATQYDFPPYSAGDVVKSNFCPISKTLRAMTGLVE